MGQVYPLIEELEKQAKAFFIDNQLADTAAVYQKICILEPDNAVHWVNLGETQYSLGRVTDAEASARQALSLQGDLSKAHLTLGKALQSQGRLKDALTSYREAGKLNPTCIDTHYFLANALRENGDKVAAVRAYQHLLQLEPKHFEGCNNLGMLLKDLGDNRKAIQYLRRALQLQSDSIATLISLGEACTATGTYSEALEHLQHAVRCMPDSGRAWCSLANAQHHAGRMQHALASYGKLAQLRPGSTEAALGQARILEHLGKHRETYEILQPLLESGHDDAIHTFFNISKPLGRREEAVTALIKLLKRTSTNNESTADVHFKLGRHYDETGEYERAFRHYQRANELTSKQFNLGKLIRFVNDNITVYNREFTWQMLVARDHSELPVFVLGMPRSGTSLVEQILASHPAVTGAGELPLVPEIVQHLAAEFPGYVYPLYVPRLSPQLLDVTAERHLHALQTLGGSTTKVTDKLPHNFRNIGLICQLFPAARIIHCTRHPLDTCLSCYFARFGTAAHGYSYNLNSVGEYYLQYRRLMEHWEKVFPDRILTVSYRQLVLEQEKTSRQLIELCGLVWDDRCLDFHNNDRFVFTLSYDQVRQPMYTRSLDRWKHYENQLQPLRDLLESNGISCE